MRDVEAGRLESSCLEKKNCVKYLHGRPGGPYL